VDSGSGSQPSNDGLLKSLGRRPATRRPQASSESPTRRCSQIISCHPLWVRRIRLRKQNALPRAPHWLLQLVCLVYGTRRGAEPLACSARGSPACVAHFARRVPRSRPPRGPCAASAAACGRLSDSLMAGASVAAAAPVATLWRLRGGPKILAGAPPHCAPLCMGVSQPFLPAGTRRRPGSI
jgi:hypothetical protein